MIRSHTQTLFFFYSYEKYLINLYGGPWSKPQRSNFLGHKNCCQCLHDGWTYLAFPGSFLFSDLGLVLRVRATSCNSRNCKMYLSASFNLSCELHRQGREYNTVFRLSVYLEELRIFRFDKNYNGGLFSAHLLFIPSSPPSALPLPVRRQRAQPHIHTHTHSAGSQLCFIYFFLLNNDCLHTRRRVTFSIWH